MRTYLLLLLISLFSFSACNSLRQVSGADAPAAISESEAASALRQALTQGIGRSIAVLHARDGFFGSMTYKIPIPQEAQRMERSLRDLGMGGMVDRAILQINRAAEDAAGHARPVFEQALREMTLTDAIGIVRGNNLAATLYFREKTSAQLTAAFSPIVRATLDQLNATRYFEEIAGVYNNFPTTQQKVNADLTAYVTARAIEALFDQIGQEEANIRNNQAARSTPLLRKVFGSR